jgi:hypothetical protein
VRRRQHNLIGVAVLAFVVGCSDAQKSKNNNSRSAKQQSMKMSTGRYNQGYKEGMRDAKMSLFDDHAGWMWLWMMEKEYEDGYKRGWADGRSMVHLEREKKSTEKQETQQRKDEE